MCAKAPQQEAMFKLTSMMHFATNVAKFITHGLKCTAIIECFQIFEYTRSRIYGNYNMRTVEEFIMPPHRLISVLKEGHSFCYKQYVMILYRTYIQI